MRHTRACSRCRTWWRSALIANCTNIVNQCAICIDVSRKGIENTVSKYSRHSHLLQSVLVGGGDGDGDGVADGGGGAEFSEKPKQANFKRVKN